MSRGASHLDHLILSVLTLSRSLDTLCATAPPEMLQAILEARSPNPDTCVVHVGVRDITWRTVWWRTNGRHKEREEVESVVHQRRLHQTSVGSACPIRILRMSDFRVSYTTFYMTYVDRKHLIVAIGSECYVTLPKGQIIPTQSAADHVDVPGGGHVLVVPITHYPTYSTIPSDLAPPIVEETNQLVFY